MIYRILAINPGSTSTKIAVYDNEKQILVKSIDHKVEDLEKYDKVQEQFEMRKEKVLKALKENNIKLDYAYFETAFLSCPLRFEGLSYLHYFLKLL